jgi:hypothetical protein
MPKMPPRSSAESLRAACAAIAVGACLVAAGSPACGPTCDTTDTANPAQRYDGGAVTGGANPYYSSSEWKRGLLHFPGGKRYELVHRLGFVPAEVAVYVSFGDTDAPATLCSGNTCVIEAVDDKAIVIKNDTCSEFWVRVVASGVSPTWGDAGASPDSGATD